MKKLGILVMAMVLVCGMSLGVMGQHNDPSDKLSNNLDEDQNVDVNIEVEEFAHIYDFDTSDMDFVLDAPSSTTGESYNYIRDFNFATNTDVNVTITETISGNLPADVGTALIVSPILTDFSDTTDENDDYGVPGGAAAESVYSFNEGMHEGSLNLGIGWYEDTGGDWWELVADDYAGKLTLTITAQ